MKIEKIDLYNYFKIPRPQGAEGYLTSYVLDNSVEVNINRLHPSILIIPGGGYEFTSFREKEPVAIEFLNKGYNSFYLEYSVRGDKVFYPFQLLEAIMALSYIEENSIMNHCDKSMISAIGFSAGAHLLGLLCSKKKKEVANNYPHLSSYSLSLASAIFGYPVVSSDKQLAHMNSFKNLTNNDEKLINELSIDKLVDNKFPPSFIWTTKTDSAVPYLNSVLLKNKLETYNINSELLIFDHGEHGGSITNENVYKTIDINNAIINNRAWVDAMFKFQRSLNIKIKD